MYDPTFLTSFVFLTNAIVAFLTQNMVYAFLMILLTISSIIFRVFRSEEIVFIDQLFVVFIVLYGSYIFSIKAAKMNPIVIWFILTTFFLTFYLYCYGYSMKKFCYDTDEEVGKVYHAILHLISSLGHHAIILS
jgi:hypothetical protein